MKSQPDYRQASVAPSWAERPYPRRLEIATAAIVGVIAGLLGFGVGWLAFSGSDQDSTPSVPAVVEQWAEAWEARDADAFAALYGTDGLFDGIFAVGFMGRDEIESSIDSYWDMGDRNQLLEPSYVFESGGGAVVVWDITSTDEEGNVEEYQAVTNFEWDWDDPNLLRTTTMSWF